MVKSVGWMRRGEVYLKVSSVDGMRFWGGKPSEGGQVVFGELGTSELGANCSFGVGGVEKAYCR